MATSNKLIYDPAYCLAEHLNYFSENVAANLAGDDFDNIFSSPKAIYQAAPLAIPSLKGKHIVIEKVIILPNNFVLKAPVTQSASVDILPSPVTSKIVLPGNIVSPPPASPTSVMKQIQIPIEHLPQMPSKVPNPMLAVAAAEAKAETIKPSQVASDASVQPTNLSKDPRPATPIIQQVPIAKAHQVPIAPKSPELTASAPQPTQDAAISPVPVTPAAAQPMVISDDDDKCQSPTPAMADEPASGKKRKAPSCESGDIRRERNRKHAKQSRQRKKEFHKSLQDSIDSLKAENDWLCSILNDSPTEANLLAPEPQDVEDLVAALQDPKNRVLSDQALASLQNLFR